MHIFAVFIVSHSGLECYNGTKLFFPRTNNIISITSFLIEQIQRAWLEDTANKRALSSWLLVNTLHSKNIVWVCLEQISIVRVIKNNIKCAVIQLPTNKRGTIYISKK